uniref:Uncharacterized protein n=1 Tax=Escherichia coli TaxID=562 RepID=A0A075MCL3_ECOLX|nr:hypothetical protein [Escherichia coli]
MSRFFFQAKRGGRRPEALVAAARRGETRSGSMRSTAERPRRGNAQFNST